MTPPRNALEDVTGAILVGGRSRRLGYDKILLPYQGKPLILYPYEILSSLFIHTYLIGHSRPELDHQGLKCIPDRFPAHGVLGGIYTALLSSPTPYVFIAAGDMPFLTQDVIDEILNHRYEADVVIPAGSRGMEPLCAVYSQSCLEPMRNNIGLGKLKVMVALAELNIYRLKVIPGKADSDPFFNVNTPEDLEKLKN